MCWYVMQVFTGNEKKTADMCRSKSDAGTTYEIFVPEYEYMKKYQGAWHRQTGVLFPGYVFIQSADIQGFREVMKGVPEYTKLLCSEGDILPMSLEDRALLEQMLDERKIFKMSEGYIEGDKIRVTTGPLAGKEGWIRKIDRHKRRAILDVEMFGKIIRTEAGLEIVRKE